ncbi:hypothetical protein [Microcoleus sp. bin38.metabat.b11b12b14.051]|uniref:hypothetical protein n=1 Tax=Microcoleus sp. bin38.metabat.b11b12b14.051 TaxID=2742709 RepID=UPI0025DB508E|nr:hypothetical protein [Microcoleus sp. bin38.metabat.b11b12b14.051]
MSRPDTYPQTMQPIQITTFQALRRSLELIIQAAPIELRNLIILNIIRGAALSGVLFLDKLIDVDVNVGRIWGRSIALFNRFHRY